MSKKVTKKTSKGSLSIKNPNAAGIDIGSEDHFVAVPEDRDEQSIRSFGCFTEDLFKIADWLKKCKIETVAMESTGVYWIPLYDILQEHGFEVVLVNSRATKNIAGKSDVADCQWILELHTYGLLKPSFRPDQQIRPLRTYSRHRDNLIKTCAMHVQRMQKILIEMNVQLHKAISDITGTTGLAILKAILDGERDPMALAKHRDYRIKCSIETIAKSLNGNWTDEGLFVLKQEFNSYMHYRSQISECDSQMDNYLSSFYTKVDPSEKPLGTPKCGYNRKPCRNTPSFDFRSHFYRITGVDCTAVPGFDTGTLQVLLSEIGTDMSPWNSEKHFTAWLGLAPNNRISGGKKLPRQGWRTNTNKAAIAFRLAAQSLLNSKCAMGAFLRRLKSRLGPKSAIKATARKLACIYYRMMKFGVEYVEQGAQYYEEKYKNRLISNLQKSAKHLGFQLIPLSQDEESCKLAESQGVSDSVS